MNPENYPKTEYDDLLGMTFEDERQAGEIYNYFQMQVADMITDEEVLHQVLIKIEAKLAAPEYDGIYSVRGALQGVARYLIEEYDEDGVFLALPALINSDKADLLLIEFALAISREDRPDLSCEIRHSNFVSHRRALDLMLAAEALAYAKRGDAIKAWGRLGTQIISPEYTKGLRIQIYKLLSDARATNHTLP